MNWWKKQARRRISVSSHLTEGITAYALEHAATEHHRLTSWSDSWSAIQQRAKLVLETYLKDQEDTMDIAVLEVEIEGDNDDDETLFDLDE